MNNAKILARVCLASLLFSGAAHAQEAGRPAVDQSDAAAVQRAQKPDPATAAHEEVLRYAEDLIKKGKPADAYAFLLPLESEFAGEERYDYLLGVAALDSGNPDKATLAFERVLLVNPNFLGARLDMARAYYQLGDMLRAKTEFEAVLQTNPSPAVRATAQRYLRAIAAQDPAKKTRLAGYVAGTAGRDSNVNNSTTQTQVVANVPTPTGPILAVATLSPTNLKAADNYYGVGAGAELTHSLNPNWGLYAGADLRQRHYNTQQAFNTVSLEGRAGAAYAADANRFRFGMLGSGYTLGGKRNFNSGGLNADWGHTFSPSNQANLFAQYLQYRFADYAMQVNDFNQEVLGAGWAHALAGGKSTLSVGIYAGAEQEVASIITTATPSGGRADGNKRFTGLRAGVQTTVGESTLLFASAGGQTGHYDRTNALFLIQRADRFYDATIGANWHWTEGWSLQPQVAYTRNSSNIAIYTYKRIDGSVTLRRDF